MAVDADLASKVARTLGAVLLNPPTGQGERSMRALRIAQSVLDCDELQVANLLLSSSADMRGIAEVGRLGKSWEEGRLAIERLLDSSEEIVFAWGVSPVPGSANVHRLRQIDWVKEQARARGSRIWTLGGEPRHPSRWHQYLSDRHGRTGGGTFQDRVREQLVANASTRDDKAQIKTLCSQLSRHS